MNQTSLNTTNAQPDEIRGDCEKSSELRWFADPDGVHRYAETGKAGRAAVFPEIPGVYEWVASGKNGRVRTGTAPTLPLAKEAAEKAVREMDAQ